MFTCSSSSQGTWPTSHPPSTSIATVPVLYPSLYLYIYLCCTISGTLCIGKGSGTVTGTGIGTGTGTGTSMYTHLVELGQVLVQFRYWYNLGTGTSVRTGLLDIYVYILVDAQGHYR